MFSGLGFCHLDAQILTRVLIIGVSRDVPVIFMRRNATVAVMLEQAQRSLRT